MKNPHDAKELADEILEEWDDICSELVYRLPHPVEGYFETEYGNWRVPDR